MKSVLVILLAVLPLGAQQPPAPPAVLRIFREDIKEGKEGAHEKAEAAFMEVAARVKYPTHILGLTAFTGTSRAVFLEGYDTFASVVDSEAALDTPEFGALGAVDAELRTSHQSQLGMYRADLSHNVGQINLPKARFFTIVTIRVREGAGQEFTELLKTLIPFVEKAGDDQPVATYQIVSGAPDGTYLFVEPIESPKFLDEKPLRRQALLWALNQYETKASAAIASEESVLYAVHPRMSYVPQEWVTADPEFWGPRPVTTKAPAKAREKSASK